MKKFIFAATIAVFAATATGATAAPVVKAPFAAEAAVVTVSERNQGYRRDNDRRFDERRHQKLSTWEVAKILRHKGYYKIHDIQFTRSVYLAKAFGRYGPVRLVVDAWDGDILSRERIEYRGYGYGYGYGRTWSGSNGKFSFTLGIR